MLVSLKKCAHPDCTFQFPEHYFSDYCAEHATPETDRVADERAAHMHANYGQTGLLVNALSSFLPSDEGAAIRAELGTSK